MKRRVSGAALVALVLATITGCSVQYDGNDAVSHEFGSDYFAVGGLLNVTETVRGDAILAGGRVSTASEVQGDLVAAAGELSVGGAIGDDLYAAGVSLYYLLTRKYPYGEIEPFQQPRFGEAQAPTRWRNGPSA